MSEVELRELANYYHDIAYKSGWWEENHRKSFDEVETLIYSELFEAFEAYRNNKYATDADLHRVHCFYTPDEEQNNFAVFRDSFIEDVKDTIGDEFADVCIRVFDWWGWSNNIVTNVKSYSGAFPSNVVSFIREEHSFLNILNYCTDTCKELKIDLPKHIYLKGEFNKLRSYRHGNKKI